MKKTRCWGIFREIANSPNRESDDENILRLTAKKLESLEIDVSLFYPDEITKWPGPQPNGATAPDLRKKFSQKNDISRACSMKNQKDKPDFIFLMCETLPVLGILCAWEQDGIMMINPVESVRNTYRDKTVKLLSGRMKFYPESSLVKTSSPLTGRNRVPCWVKRGDVHATQDGDVTFVQSTEDLLQCLKRLSKHGIKDAVLQKHIDGDLIKFYGVGVEETNWFHFFYHKNQNLKNYPFNNEELKEYARAGAKVLGLEIFGGDAIIGPSGVVHIIDLNAWPSFALFREEASTHISIYIISKIQSKLNKTQIFAEARR